MSEICTRLPLNNGYTKERFIEKCKKWIIGGLGNGINRIDYNPASGENYSLTSDTTKAVIQIKPYTDEKRTLVGFRLMKPEETALWTSDCIYIEQGGKKEVLIQLDRKIVGPAKKHAEQPKKPYIIKMFLDDCKEDGGMDIDDRFLRAEDNLDLCTSVMLGIADNILPVVYMSCDRNGRAALNPKYIAKRLGGLAHVICENTVETSFALKNSTNGRNPHSGYIGVFWPHNDYCRKFRLDYDGDTVKLEHEVFDYVVESLVNKLDFSTETFQRVAQLQMRQKIIQLSSENKLAKDMLDEALNNNSTADDLEEFINAFDQDTEELNQRIRQLEEENRSLKAQVEGYKDAFTNRDTVGSPIYTLGEEQEFYSGESRDLITDILKQVQNKYDSNSHAYALINSLIKQNPKSDINKKKLDKVKRLLGSGDELTGSKKSELKSLGFEIDGSGAHYKLTYMGDPRFAFTVAKTGSDNRNGKNLFSTIDRYLSVEKRLY